MQFASATTTQTDLDEATQALAQHIRKQIDAPAFDFAVLFMSPHFARAAIFIADKVRQLLAPSLLLGCSCEGVIGRDSEIENEPALSLVVAHLPRVQIQPFVLEPAHRDTALTDSERFRQLVGALPETKLFLVVADPFSTLMDDLLNAFNAYFPGVPIIGGMASGAQRSGGNALLLNDRVVHAGAVGVAMAGNLNVDVIVSQGCRPIGPALKVTHAHENVIMTLENQPALTQVQKVAEGLTDEDRLLLQHGLFVGRAIDSTKDVLGRGDFLIRGVMGFDRRTGAMAVGDMLHAGETIQFHLRDQNTATEDLELLLMPQVLDEPPQGALLFSCNGRGTRLYDHPNGDISLIQKMLGKVSLAGFFCAGEIGPIGGKNFLHGHTASMALFRDAD